MSRQLASIQKVEEVRPIEGRDRIELIRVEGWWVIAQKGRYNPGDYVVYFEVDSVLPPDPRWSADLERYKHRVRIMKMAGVFSQGYTMPTSELRPAELKKLGKSGVKPGTDLTETLGVTKYEPDSWNRGTTQKTIKKRTLLQRLFGFAKPHRTNPYHQPFPSFLDKTDETRVQKLGGMLQIHEGKPVYITEKLHGSSMTVYLRKGHFGVCSRNLELLRELPALPKWKQLAMACGLFKQERLWRKNSEGPVTTHFWQLALDQQLENRLRNLGRNLALQGEIIGPNICDNIYKLSKHTYWIFSMYDIDAGRYLSYTEMVELCERLALRFVPVLGQRNLHANIDQWLVEAEGYSSINPSTLREGFVVRTLSMEGKAPFSFKAVSQPWMAKHAA